jgi:hypothetical protein
MRLPLSIATLAATLLAGSAPAALVEFTVDPSRSFVTVMGAIFTDSFQPVRPGSSKASYQGAFFGDVSGDALRIQGAGPRDTVEHTGFPDDPVPYELVAHTFQGDAFISILSIDFNGGADNDAGPFSISAGRFPGHLVRFFIGGGTLVFQAPGSNAPAFHDLHGRGSPNITQREGTIVTEGGIQTITVPLDMNVLFSLREENDTILNFSGAFVATRAVPEPSSVMLALLGAGFLFRRVREAGRSPR